MVHFSNYPMKSALLYKTPAGFDDLLLCAEGGLLTGVQFIKSDCHQIELCNSPVLQDTCRWLDIYFSGKQPDFMPSLKLQGTAFQNKVWNLLLSIPYAHTVSYGYIAKQIECRSSQAVGRAVGSNPIMILVPCHRVIHSDGSIMGYAGGIENKRRLLKLENQ